MRLPRIGLMFLGFAILMVLQMALGKAIYGQLNLLGALYVLWAAALAMLANRLVQVFGAATFAAALAWFLVAGTLISALIGLIQLFGVQTPLAPLMLPQLHGRIYANTGQPNHLASYLCLGLASTGYLWSTRRLGLVLAVTVCAMLLAVLATSGSRAVWLYGAAFVVFSAVMGLLRPSAEFKRLLVFSIAISWRSAGCAVGDGGPDAAAFDRGGNHRRARADGGDVIADPDAFLERGVDDVPRCAGIRHRFQAFRME